MEQPPLPKYMCHKVVSALKIKSVRVTLIGATLYPEDSRYDPIYVSADFFHKRMPGPVEGYFVRYKDGFESWSPTEAFEDGYTLIEE